MFWKRKEVSLEGGVTTLSALLMLTQPGRELEQCVQNLSKASAELCLFVVFFTETNILHTKTTQLFVNEVLSTNWSQPNENNSIKDYTLHRKPVERSLFLGTE